jgi:hypothetical protein
MPTVPTLNRPVQDAALPNARVKDLTSVETFGGGERVAAGFRASTQLAQQGAEIIENEAKRADQIQLTQAYADAMKAKNDLMYNPKSGAVTRKGRDSFGAMEEYLPQFDQRMQEIEDRLGNDRQKGLFAEIKTKQKVDFDGDLQRHIFKESQEYDAETLKYGLDAAREDALLNYQTPGKVGESIFAQKALVMNHAKNNGRSPEWTEMTLKKIESDTHKDVMERMLANGEDMKASIYFQTVKESLTGDTATALEKSLEEGSLRGNSQRIVDGLVQKHGSLTSAMREVRQIEDPKLRDYTQDRLKSEFSLREAEKKNYIENLERGAYDIVDKTGDLRQIPPSQWSQFDGGTRAALKRYAEEKRGGGSIKTDMETYYNLKELAGDPATRKEFENLNLMKFKDKLSDADMKSFISAQTGSKSGDGKAKKELDGWRTDTQIVTDAYSAMGLDKKSKSGKEKYQQFANRVEQEQIAMQEKLGRKLNNTEMQEITDKLKIQVITEKGFFFDTKKRLFEVDPNAGEYEVTEVPPKDRMEIERVLRKYNKPVTESAILELFTKGLNNVSK